MAKVSVSSKSNPIAGFFVGIIFLIIGVILLWWNEGRTVKTAQAIDEAKENFIEVGSTEIVGGNEGKLIATNGLVSTEETITDNTFNVSLQTAALRRNVEIYEWKEKCDEDDDGYETCTYSLVWDDELIDSNDFKEKEGHQNPTSVKYEGKTIYAQKINVGKFELPEDLYSSLTIDGKYTELNQEVADSLGLTINGDYYTDVIDEPSVGNIRVSFAFYNRPYISMMGVQRGSTIKEYNAKSGKNIFRMYNEQLTGDEMINKMVEENNFQKIMFRLLGMFFIIVACLAIISPIQKLASFIPLFGRMINSATSFIALLTGLIISFVVIAVSWLVYRPLISIALLVAVGVLIALIVTLTKKNKAKNEQLVQNGIQPQMNAVQPTMVNQQFVQQQPTQPFVQQPVQQVTDQTVVTQENNGQNQ